MGTRLPSMLQMDGLGRGSRPPKRPSDSASQASIARIHGMFASSKKKKSKQSVVYVAPECYSIPITGVHVSLPKGLVPYRTQKLMMVRIIQTLVKSQNALAESPTGSGKTMALLASSCGWLRSYMTRREESRTACPVHGIPRETTAHLPPILSVPATPIEENFVDDDISVVYESTFETSMRNLTDDVDAEFMAAKQPTAMPSIPVVGHIPSLTWKDTLQVEEEEEEDISAEKKAQCSCLPRVRIYYGTRTHKQIGQVVKEFGRLDHATTIKHTILGSREQLCINEDVRRGGDITAACKERISPHGIGCTFKTNMRGSYEKGFQVRNALNQMGTVVWDVETLVEALGEEEKLHICPYFSATRVLSQDADIIFCPFNYMLDPIIRNSSDVHLKDAVVILDEAHNVEDTCRDSASFDFTEKEIHDAKFSVVEKLEAVGKAIKEMDGKTNNEEISDDAETLMKLREFQEALNVMIKVLAKMHSWMKEVAIPVPSPPEYDRFGRSERTVGWEQLLLSLQTPQERSLLYDKDSADYKMIQNAMMKLVDREVTEGGRQLVLDALRPSSTAIVAVEKFLYFLTFFTKEDKQSMYKLNVAVERPSDALLAGEAAHGGYGGPKNMVYSQGMELWGKESFMDSKAPPGKFHPIREGYRISVHLWCMSPELSFTDAFEHSRSVILASGTLCPTDTLKTELGLPFAIEMEGEQVIPPENILAAVVTRGPSGHTMKGVYKEMYDTDDFVNELSRIVRSICFACPSGILLFLPSYRLLDRLYEYMQRSTILRQIEMKKVVVKEPRRSSEMNQIMDKYEKAIANPQMFGPQVTGSLMLAVFRGKVSEGLDFADDRARCVITVGIPYPNAMDEKVKEKKNYNNDNATKLRILNGDQWYTAQAFRALNQALGRYSPPPPLPLLLFSLFRCLRHRGDWGAIVMVEDRLAVQATQAVANARNSAAKISKWIREQMMIYGRYDEFEVNLKAFMQRMQTGKEKEEWE